jgi:hypothetical protein
MSAEWSSSWSKEEHDWMLEESNPNSKGISDTDWEILVEKLDDAVMGIIMQTVDASNG